MKHTIENKYLKVCAKEEGAELVSIIDLATQTEMLWQGDKEYWEGQSPILFPTIGNCAAQTIHVDGKAYQMPKHGLVRLLKFHMAEKGDDFIKFEVSDTPYTLEHYPYHFRLTVCYKLEGKALIVRFQVNNEDNEGSLPFQLGAHPAFNLPEFAPSDDTHGYLSFNFSDKIVSNGLKPGGYLWPEGSFDVRLDDSGMLELNNHTFDCDTLLDTREIATTCSLYNKNRKKLLTVEFDSPVLALWAPRGDNAPFVCIEPWWGCCDQAEYDDEFSKRPWTVIVAPRQEHVISYKISMS